jgi:hypothetical protein
MVFPLAPEFLSPKSLCNKDLGLAKHPTSKEAVPKTEVLEQPQSLNFFTGQPYLKSEGRRSVRLHFSHSAWFLTLPFSKTVFILTSPPQEQKNFWVALEVRAFLLAWAIFSLLEKT